MVATVISPSIARATSAGVQPVIVAAALLLHHQQVAGEQAGEMAARRRRRHFRDVGQFLRRHRAAGE
jgi:hypothetical protein